MMGFRRQYANRRDANEPEVVKGLTDAGLVVYRLDQPVDLLVIAEDGTPWLLEVKGPKGKLTDAQMRFFMVCPRNTGVVKSAAEAFALMGIARHD
jgi:hypothetical protein